MARSFPRPRDTSQSNEPPTGCACGGSGWIRVQDGDKSGVVRCACAKARIIQSRVNALPERYRGTTLENYIPSDDLQRNALTAVRENLGGNLYLHGGYGRGKTHLAAAQYKTLAAAGECVYWRTMWQLVAELRDAELHDAHSVVRHAARYGDSLHLFLDDVDKYKPTEWKWEALFDLFDTIWTRELRITVTSNLSLRMLVEGENLHPAIVRRFDDMCLAIEV